MLINQSSIKWSQKALLFFFLMKKEPDSHSFKWAVADPDLKIRGGGGGGTPDPDKKGEGPGLPKKIFPPFGPHKGGGGGAGPPGPTPGSPPERVLTYNSLYWSIAHNVQVRNLFCWLSIKCWNLERLPRILVSLLSVLPSLKLLWVELDALQVLAFLCWTLT